jgi:thymidylate synthase
MGGCCCRNRQNLAEQKYLDLMQNIIQEGEEIKDRTGVGTYSKLNQHLCFSLANGSFPLLTTKEVRLKAIFNELNWFLSGETDAKLLAKRGTNIWNQNSDRKTLDKLGFEKRAEGDCGPIYGFQWRYFGKPYIDSDEKGKRGEGEGGGFDQIRDILSQLKKNPFSRRIILSAWNPPQHCQMVLPPCHVLAQFIVRPPPHNQLNCILYMRSGDMFLGVPFNIASYALLTIYLAAMTEKTPGMLYIIIGDAHVYKNHVDAVKKQCKRKPKPFPTLKLLNSSKKEDPVDFTWTDLQLEDYQPEAAIPAPMAV